MCSLSLITIQPKALKRFFFFYISKLEPWGEIKGQNIQWKGRWVLTFGKEGFLKSLLSLQDEVRKADPGSSVSLRQADSQNSLPPPAVMKCRGKEKKKPNDLSQCF